MTQNPSGILWRVQPAAAPGQEEPNPVVPAWARLVTDGDVVDPGNEALAVAARGRSVLTRIPAAETGGARLLVLAERADPVAPPVAS